MNRQRRNLTDEDIRRAIEVLSDEEQLDDMDNIETTNFSDSEEDFEENGSEVEDNQSGSDTGEEEEGENWTYTGRDNTEWDVRPANEGRVRAHNIIKGKLHKVILPPGKHIDSPVDAMQLFLDKELINVITENTNIHGRGIEGDNWKDTDEEEIYAYIGLLINAGIYKQGILDYNEFWDPLFGSPIFRATMSKNRFVNLQKHIRFDDISTRSARREKDKFAPMREVWNKLNINLTKYYIPGKNLTIDEQLVPFRGRVSFRQYIPSKPDKYGMKIWWICDSETSYPLLGIPYLGKEGLNRGQNLGEKVVLELCQRYERTNRNITFDNYFTSYNLAQQLLSKGLTCIGTLRKNKGCIPPNFLPNNRREVGTSIFGFRKNITLVSYVPRKSKAVILLSTMHHNDAVSGEEKHKPIIILDYNETKGGVDTLDQLAHAYSTKRKSNRWPMTQFYNIIDIAGVAAMICWLNIFPDYELSKKNHRRKLFLKQLVTDLVAPHIKRRSTKYLSKSKIATINNVLKRSSAVLESEPEVPPTRVNKSRCYICPAKISRCSKQKCSACENTVCNEHSSKKIICQNCKNNNGII